VLRRRITAFESKRRDGTFPDSFCGVSGHRKAVETSKNDTKRWNDTPSGSIISQLAAGVVGADSIWEMSGYTDQPKNKLAIARDDQNTDTVVYLCNCHSQHSGRHFLCMWETSRANPRGCGPATTQRPKIQDFRTEQSRKDHASRTRWHEQNIRHSPRRILSEETHADFRKNTQASRSPWLHRSRVGVYRQQQGNNRVFIKDQPYVIWRKQDIRRDRYRYNRCAEERSLMTLLFV